MPEFGITSACAENTVYLSPVPSLFEDHLRMCGEYRNEPDNEKIVAGSPPHVRRIRPK
ncbi:hypothetical protein FD04_GL001350 [Secundilactobacillus odoratitofui DSM 19909 = JCM 15043]|uniref:Uncharacterized protein n=1 Tax=Secundilactobacillus odoratitofui DSM 19909 = JCM 15043 TaxID=1423776 RepID=A0A0R1LN77_9LACO|nr:hypothetical protein FD04_GL001350 [Secundilactobacillus odoratitofui DSM 19909 = JCM 15043]